ncbi:MAG: hypothetical protein IPN29_16610 [Saprospiraceae bacterium]|nr:hypothetical protein [Saprospiraceae bacterium]
MFGSCICFYIAGIQYLSLDTSSKPAEPHLILVGVDWNGNEMKSYYNVTRPCPPGCSE